MSPTSHSGARMYRAARQSLPATTDELLNQWAGAGRLFRHYAAEDRRVFPGTGMAQKSSITAISFYRRAFELARALGVPPRLLSRK